MKHIFDFTGNPKAGDIERLLAAGANPNAKNEKGYTPFMMASCFGYEGAARALINAGADINAQDNKGNTALLLACYGGQKAAVKFLLDVGADVSIKDGEGGDVFDAMRENRHLNQKVVNEITQMLKEKGAEGTSYTYVKGISMPSI